MLNWLLRRGARSPVPLVLYARDRSPACEQMRRQLADACPRLSQPFTLTVIDVDLDPRLASEYGESVPVLWIGGRRAFSGHMHSGEFARRFERMATDFQRARALERDLAAHGKGNAR